MKQLKAAPRALFTFMLSVSFLTIGPAVEAANTPDYDRCTNREGGEWNYGRAPNVCSANVYGEDSFITTNLNVTIFGDTKTRDTERKRYMTEMNALIKEASRVYLLKRKPGASTTEISYWTLGLLATASNESYWSHYRRTTDGRLKMMRGDVGHGHGLMQIDDRAHYPAVSKGLAWNLATNLNYAMDIFYDAWQKAPTLSCVGSSSNWVPRIRAAWSAYNGGPSKGCRWTNTKDAWAQNDKNFYSALSGRRWDSFVTDAAKKTDIAIACLMEKKESCAPVTVPDPTPEAPVNGRLYRIGAKICLAKGGQFSCLDDERDRVCLNEIGAASTEQVIEWTPTQASKYIQNAEDRHLLCHEYDRSLVAVGSAIELRKSVNLRSTPAGGLLTTLPAGSRLQVRDFELRNTVKDRYYRVKSGDLEGYVYAGNANDASSWALEISSKQAVGTSLARVGDWLYIKNAAGINMRTSPAGELIRNILPGNYLMVEEVVARSSDNKIYYKVNYWWSSGYIYAGSLLPKDTLADWAVPYR